MRFRTLSRVLSMPSLFLTAMAISFPSQAHFIDVELSGFGTATIDGFLNLNEWAMADTVNFDLITFGETHPTTIHVMNDTTDLFLAVELRNDDFKASSIGDQGDVLNIFFDNDHDGRIALPDFELGDDGMHVDNLGPMVDLFGCESPVCESPSITTFQPDIAFACGGSNGSHTPIRPREQLETTLTSFKRNLTQGMQRTISFSRQQA